MGSGTFYGCSALAACSIGGSHIGIPDAMFSSCGKLSRLTVLNDITSIGTVSFYQCGSLTNAPIGTNIVSIGNGAFSYCSSLTNVTFPNTLTTIVDNAFYQCIGLGSLVIPDSVTSIGSGVFYSCTGVTNLVFGTHLASIGSYAFWGCSGLTQVVIPDSVTCLGDYAFYQCGNLNNVRLSAGLTSIGNWVFTYCNLSSLIIPAGVTNIGDYALGGWYFQAATIYFLGNAPGQGLGVLQGDGIGTTVYYLPGTTGWSSSFATYPAVLWNPQAQTHDGIFGVRTNQFGFNITGNNGVKVKVEACADLTQPTWIPVGTNILTGGTAYLRDTAWTNYPRRFYRLNLP